MHAGTGGDAASLYHAAPVEVELPVQYSVAVLADRCVELSTINQIGMIGSYLG
jgi:hypothetical protein